MTVTSVSTVDSGLTNLIHDRCSSDVEWLCLTGLQICRIGKTVKEIRFSKIHFMGVKPKLCGGVCRKMYKDLGLTPKLFQKVLICTTIKTWVTSYI